MGKTDTWGDAAQASALGPAQAAELPAPTLSPHPLPSSQHHRRPLRSRGSGRNRPAGIVSTA